MEASTMTVEQHFERYKQIMDAHLAQGGLDPERHRSPGEVGKYIWYYSFTYDFLGSFRSYIYPVQEGDKQRAFIFTEVQLGELDKNISSKFLEGAFYSNLTYAGVNRLYMRPDRVLAAGFRVPSDAITDSYFAEMLEELKASSKSIYEKLRQQEVVAQTKTLEEGVPTLATA